MKTGGETNAIERFFLGEPFPDQIEHAHGLARPIDSLLTFLCKMDVFNVVLHECSSMIVAAGFMPVLLLQSRLFPQLIGLVRLLP